MKKIGSSLLCFAIIAGTALPSMAIDVKGGLKSAVSSAKETAAANATEEGKKALADKVDSIINRSSQITKDFGAAVLNASDLLGIKDKINQTQEEQKSSKKSKKNSEADSVEVAIAGFNAALADEAQQQEYVEKIKNFSAEQKAKLGECLNNMGKGAAGYGNIATESLELLQGLTNDPASAMQLGSKLRELKKVATNAPSQAKQFGTTVQGLAKLATKAGVKTQNTSSKTTKTKNTTDF